MSERTTTLTVELPVEVKERLDALAETTSGKAYGKLTPENLQATRRSQPFSPSGCMRVKWTRRALRALDEITEYIARDRPLAAQRMFERVQEAVISLAAHPDLGRQGRVPGTRELIVAGTPFIIPYRVREDDVEILSVLHAARRWPEQL
jgi:toxin ParE1/3/4